MDHTGCLAFEQVHVHDVYDQIAEHFSATRYKQWPQVLKYLQSLPFGSIGIDLGCGNGKNIYVTKNSFTIGTDRCVSLLRHAQAGSRTVSGDLVCACMLSTILRQCSMDFALSIATIHHLASRERRLEALSEISRVLRTGGTALVFVWAFDNQDATKSSVLAIMLIIEICDHRRNRNNDQLEYSDGGCASEVCKPAYCRYYHLFKEGELEQLIACIPSLVIRLTGRDAGNWFAIIEKVEFK
ncbi:hypothetical protein DI09_33p210 [Mitosporidium daphniae]|uniref:Methyltransferase type 11 domain-containing protein n=1 Tax=Mitosporidium daphniae TaxID=1485682 RepID=A0A098VRR2_9MICR|nr:uncharacterized protein DI09_33p210 [Mitosporidium daphniae]KGG51504.1 hypothetical protein DI09_33p210 [Mitosporidium daphniae]|eukprot:XP_013237931.1 uncharacterized protein DI09_33p210 [Mitosporidium daphniae]